MHGHLVFWSRGPDHQKRNFYIVRIGIFSQNLGARPKMEGPRATGPLLMSIPVNSVDPDKMPHLGMPDLGLTVCQDSCLGNARL